MTRDVALLLLAAGVVTMPGVVATMAAERGVDVSRALATVTAESAWDANAVGDEGEAVGLWQFHPGTWSWGAEYVGRPAWAAPSYRRDPLISTIVALDLIEAGYGDYWTGWRIQWQILVMILDKRAPVVVMFDCVVWEPREEGT